MRKIPDNYIDSCISDFPYNLSFMGNKWDTQKNFYEWCFQRAEGLFRIVKPGGYVLIFGHPKTNHRMKCAFEDIGFKIVEEIEWVYLSGMPKSQDIGKMFDKKAGKEREVVGSYKTPDGRDYTLENSGKNGYKKTDLAMGRDKGKERRLITEPQSELAKQWDGWKTAGLKPSHEPITVFQKPIEKNYCNNIEKYGCGGMNIDACRVPTSDNLNGGAYSKNKNKDNEIYGKLDYNCGNYKQPEGRFPPNMVFDKYTAQILDEQTGKSKSSGGRSNSVFRSNSQIYRTGEDNIKKEDPGYGDTGGGSRLFPIIKYNTKVSPKERKLKDGTRNHHVTVKPKELIKWLIKLVTPKEGKTLDITAGSCTHGVACEELNRDEGYNLQWCNIEIDEDDKGNSLGYIDFGKKRLEEVINE